MIANFIFRILSISFLFVLTFCFGMSALNGQEDNIEKTDLIRKNEITQLKIERVIYESKMDTTVYISSIEKYNNQGLVVETTLFNIDGKIKRTFSNKYSKDGELKIIESYFPRNSSFSTRDFIYNKKGQLKQEESFVDDKLSSIARFSYDKKGRIKTKKTEYYKTRDNNILYDDIKTKYKYNKKGQLQKTVTTSSNEDGKSVTISNFVYKNNSSIVKKYFSTEKGVLGELTGEEIYDAEGKLTSKIDIVQVECTYNENGIELQWNIGDEMRNEYTYLDSGLIDESRRYHNDRLIGKIIYKYSK